MCIGKLYHVLVPRHCFSPAGCCIQVGMFQAQLGIVPCQSLDKKVCFFGVQIVDGGLVVAVPWMIDIGLEA